MLGENLREYLEALAASTPPGNFAEVGVRDGGSAWGLLRVAKAQGREMFCYDTFEGMPYADPGMGDGHPVGDLRTADEAATRTALEGAHVVKGVFPASAVPMGLLAFVHLDCDQYQSVREALEHFIPRMVSGGIIWMDDAPLLAGAKRAAEEVLGESCQTDPEYGRWFYQKP